MLTRNTPGLPSAAAVQVSGNTLQARIQSLEQQLVSLAAEHNRLLDAVRSAFEDLNREGALDIADAAIVASRGIKFPATQNASTDVNTLDDYEEVTGVSSTITAAAGTITTATGTLDYQKIGNRYYYHNTILVTTNGTGATAVRFTLPATATLAAGISGINLANGMALTGNIAASGTYGTVVLYDSTYPVASGQTLEVWGSFVA